MIADSDFEVSKLYGMLPAEVEGDPTRAHARRQPDGPQRLRRRARQEGQADPRLSDDDRPQLRRGAAGDRLAAADRGAQGRDAGQLAARRRRDHRRLGLRRRGAGRSTPTAGSRRSPTSGSCPTRPARASYFASSVVPAKVQRRPEQLVGVAEEVHREHLAGGVGVDQLPGDLVVLTEGGPVIPRPPKSSSRGRRRSPAPRSRPAFGWTAAEVRLKMNPSSTLEDATLVSSRSRLSHSQAPGKPEAATLVTGSQLGDAAPSAFCGRGSTVRRSTRVRPILFRQRRQRGARRSPGCPPRYSRPPRRASRS